MWLRGMLCVWSSSGELLGVRGCGKQSGVADIVLPSTFSAAHLRRSSDINNQGLRPRLIRICGIYFKGKQDFKGAPAVIISGLPGSE